MAKQIIVLNGSPRPNGNTAALIKAFTEGAESAGNTVDSFFLDGMNISGCKGCLSGGKDPLSPCVQKDDMDKIYPVFNKADVAVMASPLYFWTITGQLRIAFDRLLATLECKDESIKRNKECIMLMPAEGDKFDEAVYYYERLMMHLKWKNLGTVLAGDVLNPGDIEGKPALEEARKLGASIK